MVNNNEAGMSSFVAMTNGATGPQTEPQTIPQYRSCMEGFWKDNSIISYGGIGYGGSIPTKYCFPGNPADTSEWSMCNAGILADDKKFVMNSYNGVFKKDSTLNFTIAFFHIMADSVAGTCPDRDIYISPYADSIQNIFDNDLICKTFPLGINSANETELTFNLFPNPVSGGQLNINFEDGGTRTIIMHNTLGQIVFSKASNMQHEVINVLQLSNGIYFVEVTSDSKQAVKKVLLSK